MCSAWVESVRYLGVYFVKARQFKCRYDRATASFYRAFNAVFGKIGRSSSEEAVLQLINSKCMPCLLYALVQLIKRKKGHWNLL